MGTRGFCLILLLAIVPTACDNTIDPFVGSDERAFAVTGFLDQGADTQYVRIAPIRPPTDASPNLPPPRVVSQDLQTGTQIMWKDSVTALEDRSLGHLFVAPFRPRAGESYVLEVHSSFGVPLRAFTRLPHEPTIEVGLGRRVGSAVLVPVLWEGILAPSSVVLTYVTRAAHAVHQVDIPYGPGSYSDSGDRVSVTNNLSRDYVVVRDALAARGFEPPIDLLRVEMTIRALSREWTEPDRGDNIENGEGFFASVAEFSIPYAVPDSVARDAGFSRPAEP